MTTNQGKPNHHLVGNPHEQFCRLSGIPPSNLQPDSKPPPGGPRSLYGRATHQRLAVKRYFLVMATLTNTLLFGQVFLGAALTALGASKSSHILITVFGAFNTVIAGAIAYLKSRGQPMRLKMYLDDLDHVVEEMENSETMWLGISENDHGYDDIDIDSKVTVRSEMARLTRLYDAVHRTHTTTNPDRYLNGTPPASGPILRSEPAGSQQQQPLPATSHFAFPASTPSQPVATAVDLEESPATAVEVSQSDEVDHPVKAGGFGKTHETDGITSRDEAASGSKFTSAGWQSGQAPRPNNTDISGETL